MKLDETSFVVLHSCNIVLSFIVPTFSSLYENLYSRFSDSVVSSSQFTQDITNVVVLYNPFDGMTFKLPLKGRLFITKI